MNVQESSSETSWIPTKARHVWTLRDFLANFDALEPDYDVTSAIFSVVITGNITVPFQLVLTRCDGDHENAFGVFLLNTQGKNNVMIDFDIGIQTSDQTLFNVRSNKGRKDISGVLGFYFYFTREDLEANRDYLLPDGCLTLVCNLTVYREKSISTVDHTFKNALEDAPRFHDDMNDHWFWTSDVTLVCADDDERKFFCNKSVLAARSEYFRDMFLNRDNQGRPLKSVKIGDVPPNFMSLVLRVMYTDDYKTVVTRRKARGLLLAANKFKFQLLKVACEEALSSDLTVKNAVSLLRLAIGQNAELLRAEAANFIRANLDKMVGTAKFTALMTEYPEVLK